MDIIVINFGNENIITNGWYLGNLKPIKTTISEDKKVTALRYTKKDFIGNGFKPTERAFDNTSLDLGEYIEKSPFGPVIVNKDDTHVAGIFAACVFAVFSAVYTLT